MKGVGLLGMRAEGRGLGVQGGIYARHLHPGRVLGIDLYPELTPYPSDWSDYDGTDLTVVHHSAWTPELVTAWAAGLRWTVSAETFYAPWGPDAVRAAGARSICVVNPEFFIWNLEPGYPRPDVFGVPTTWHMDRIPGAVLLPTPIDAERLPWRHRTGAGGPLRVLHVAGHPAVYDRAGTVSALHAMRLVKAPVQLTVAAMTYPGSVRDWSRGDTSVVWQVGRRDDYAPIYDQHDVLLAPSRYSGQQLSLIQGSASGMPVITIDAEPQNGWGLPGVAVPSVRSRQFRSQGGPVTVHDGDARALAAAVTMYARDRDRLAADSAATAVVREAWSWGTVGPLWHAALDSGR